jgi:hypothetical protein
VIARLALFFPKHELALACMVCVFIVRNRVFVVVVKWGSSAVDVGHSYCFMATISKAHNNNYTEMRRLTTGMRSEKWVIRRFRRCANVH